MQTIPQKELRNNVAAVLRRAESGEVLTVTVSGQAVAELGPIRGRQCDRRIGIGEGVAQPCSPRACARPGRDARRLERSILFVRALLDTSVLIGDLPPDADIEGAISVASIAELHFGVLVAPDEDERARRVARLDAIESAFDPLPINVEIARSWGQLAAAVLRRGGSPRRRQIDLAIAATAQVHDVPLLTHDAADFQIIDDLVVVVSLGS